MTGSRNETHTRRDALRLGGGLAAAGAAIALTRQPSAAQDATPVADDQAMAPAHPSKTTISLETAEQLVSAAQGAAAAMDAAMAIAVVDESGLLKAFARMDGVNSAATIDLVQMKAYSAASFRTPTHQLAEGVMEDTPRAASMASIPGFTLMAGGYPIVYGGEVIGGLGIGGGSPQQDMQVAEAALAVVEMAE